MVKLPTHYEHNDMHKEAIDNKNKEITSLTDQLQWSLKNEEQYKNALSEAQKELKELENDCNQDQQYIKQLIEERDILKAECAEYNYAVSKLIDKCNELEKK